MKIQIDTQDHGSRKEVRSKHSSLYIFVAFTILAFALLYVYGYLIYHE